MRWLLLALFVCTSRAWLSPFNTTEFYSLNGKRADPCHIGLSAANPDCTYDQWPWQAVTYWAPSRLSYELATSLSTISSYFGTGVTLQISGKNIPYTAGKASVALSTPSGRCSAISTTLSVSQATVTGTGTSSPSATDPGRTLSFAIPLDWMSTSLEFEDTPRAICYSPDNTTSQNNGYIYTGFKFKVVWHCVSSSSSSDILTCPPPLSSSDSRLSGATTAAKTQAALLDQYLDTDATRSRGMKSTCCSGSGVSQCINTNIQSCCGVAGSTLTKTKCCSTSTELVQWQDAPCPCFLSTKSTDCTLVGESCCLPTKYPELTSSTNYGDQAGECYNSATHRCCDTGKRFDPGSHQCCPINGIQSLDIPCPCANDTHCIGDIGTSDDDSQFSCCRQYDPTPYEVTFETSKSTSPTICDKYANFPTGTGPAQVQPCLGHCINKNYQMCCNGVSCVKKYEQCCNSTCCDVYAGTCQKIRRPGAPGQWNNFQDYDIEFEACTIIEQMNTVKAFWVFVWPAQLMLCTFLTLAISLAYASHANKYAAQKYRWIERIMIVVAGWSAMFSIPLFFAPLYKYGTLIVVFSAFAIITAASRVRWLNVICVALHGLLLLYLFDPFHANIIFNFSSMRTPRGNTDPDSMGILHVTRKMWRKWTDIVIPGATDHGIFVHVQDAILPSSSDSTPVYVNVKIGSEFRSTMTVPVTGTIAVWNQKLLFTSAPTGSAEVRIYDATNQNPTLLSSTVIPSPQGNQTLRLDNVNQANTYLRVNFPSVVFDGAPANPTEWCTSYFEFFKFDSITRDDRIYNPLVQTFGYCSRGWAMALFLFEGVLFILLLSQQIITLVALIIRFKDPWSPVHLEVQY